MFETIKQIIELIHGRKIGLINIFDPEIISKQDEKHIFHEAVLFEIVLKEVGQKQQLSTLLTYEILYRTTRTLVVITIIVSKDNTADAQICAILKAATIEAKIQLRA